MGARIDLDELILKILRDAGRGLSFTEIKAGILRYYEKSSQQQRQSSTEMETRHPTFRLNDKQLKRSLQRLWEQCKVARIDKPSKWGPHSFYIPSSMFGRREETRLADGSFGAVMSYLEEVCQRMPFEEAWKNLIGNVSNWLKSLQDPTVKNAYRNFFHGSEGGRDKKRTEKGVVKR